MGAGTTCNTCQLPHSLCLWDAKQGRLQRVITLLWEAVTILSANGCQAPKSHDSGSTAAVKTLKSGHKYHSFRIWSLNEGLFLGLLYWDL